MLAAPPPPDDERLKKPNSHRSASPPPKMTSPAGTGLSSAHLITLIFSRSIFECLAFGAGLTRGRVNRAHMRGRQQRVDRFHRHGPVEPNRGRNRLHAERDRAGLISRPRPGDRRQLVWVVDAGTDRADWQRPELWRVGPGAAIVRPALQIDGYRLRTGRNPGNAPLLPPRHG